MIISICGLKGSYAETAAIKMVGENVSFLYCNSFTSALESVQKNQSDFAVLPVKTSNSGFVKEVKELLFSDNYIVKQKYNLNTHHCLLALKGTDIRSIDTVYSHPKALQECSLYLNKINVSERVIYNTAAGAKHVAEHRLVNVAAIASKLSAKVYGLEIIANNIENNDDVTTFYLVGVKYY
ncbi:prephenate dehydratase domain-containing protein [Aquibacillus kalidii]|uniref:prephenate dehydratase domain-containing protein n=1 Tax=Aquibacillus kalidii TaxID=2762597 RepID=UPI001644FB63|nr:prephenate dehydratase domain-containing protein [Aquibacillus kalidii]